MFGLLKRKTVPIKWKIISTVAFFIMIVVNALAGSTTLIGGTGTAAVSDKYSNLFTPAGFTFAIWSVIYVLLAYFLTRVWGLWTPKKPRLDASTLTTVLRLFSLTCVINIAWLFAWQFEALMLSVILMTGLLATLVFIYRQLATKDMSTSEATAVKLPFSIYTAWISVAIIANISTLLVKAGWGGWGLSDSGWMVGVLVLATLIGLGVGLVWRDPAFIWVFVWAFFGILVNHVTTLNGKYQDVIITLTVLMPILAVYALLMGIGHLMVLREQRTSIRGS